MMMNERDFRALLAAGASAMALCGASAWAQVAVPAEDDDSVDLIDDEAVDSVGDDSDQIVVTGSRIRRDAFTSSSPLQVIEGDTIEAAGFLNLAEALQSTPVVNGVQTTLSVSSQFISDSGPGAQTIGLRGLGSARTLTLQNGRRLAPAGIEGAPSVPDTGLIPSSVIQRVDILLDGASSVYGSDAVSGVVNLILRDDFEGVTIGGQHNQSEYGNGNSSQVNFLIGSQGERTSFTFAGEYFTQEALFGNDRGYQCVTARTETFPDFPGDQTFCGSQDIDETGVQLGTGGQFQSFAAFPFGAILLGRPGTDNPAAGEIPNFELADLGGNFNGLYRLSVPLREDVNVIPEFERTTFYMSSKTDMSDFLEGTELWTEFNFANRQTFNQSNYGVISAAVTPDNPFIESEGFTIDGAGPTESVELRPVNPIRGGVDAELSQYRLFSGLRGDLGFVGSQDWDYEVFAGYTRSQGYSTRPVILEENLVRSLNTEVDPNTGAIVCSALPNPTAPFNSGITREPCVPFNPFFPGLYPLDGSAPEFEDPLLRDYLEGSRSSTTFVDERIAGGFITGPILDLPAGSVQVVAGAEWRETGLETKSDDVTARGLGDGFFLDRPTSGRVELWELYGEVFVPLLSDKPFAETLELEAAGRYVDHEFYGSNETYSFKGVYSPVEALTLRATYGTSFRAPNLRELFLEGQSGFQDVTDPCEVPTLAQVDTDDDGVLDTYDIDRDDDGRPDDADGDGIPDLDPRTPQVLTNCQAEGIDPFSLAIGVNTGSVETFSAGNSGLDPETSTSWTYGAVFEQPWFDSFDLRLAVTAWEIEIEGSVFEPSAGFLVNECYTSPEFPDNPFCTRRLRNETTGFLQEIDATPFNIAQENASGVDYNVSVGTDFDAFGKSFDVSVNTLAAYQDELSQTIILGDADPDYEDEAGQIGSPHWRITSNQALRWDDFQAFWQVRYIGAQAQDLDLDDLTQDTVPANCFDPDRLDDNGAADPLNVPSCYSVKDVFYHDVSFQYAPETWAVRLGVRNLFDEQPPQIDEDVTGVTDDPRNVPLGVGYDRIGRTFFINLEKTF